MKINLTTGAKCKTPSPAEEAKRIQTLKDTVEAYLADTVAQMVKDSKAKGIEAITFHQDSFAAGYDVDEYTLLGMAIKYAGLHGIPIQIHGTNHETF